MPVLHERTPGGGQGQGDQGLYNDPAKKRYSLPAHFAIDEPPYTKSTTHTVGARGSGTDKTEIPNKCCHCVKIFKNYHFVLFFTKPI